VEADGEREGEGFAAPRGLHAQGEDNKVESSVEDDGVRRGADGIAEDAGAVDVAAATVEEGIVEEEVDATVRGEVTNQERGSEVPEFVDGPHGGPHEAVVGIVGPSVDETPAAHHSRDGTTGGAEDPGGEEFPEDREGRGGEE